MPGPRADRGQYTPRPRRRRPSAPLSDTRSSYAGGRGEAQQRGTPGYANTQSISRGGPAAFTQRRSSTSLSPTTYLQGLLSQAGPVSVDVPSIVPPAFRGAVAIHGQRLDEALREAGSDLTGPEYLAKLIEFESGWDPKAENPSSAFGFGQFIDSTAQDFRSRLGVETQDPNRPKQMIKGASMHASGKHGYGALYAGYNPGYSNTDPIPAVASGQNVNVPVPRQKIDKVLGRPPSPAVAALTALGLDGGKAPSVDSPATLVKAKPRKPATIVKIGKLAERMGLTVGEHPKWGGVDPVHTGGSFHYSGAAIDVTGDADKLARFNQTVAKRYGADLEEMFYDPGISINEGQPSGPIGGHGSHVHVAETEGARRGLSGVAAPGGSLVSSGVGGAVGGLSASGSRTTAEERPSAAPVQVRRSPLSARAATPTALTELLGGEEGEDILAEILQSQRFRPRRRR